MYIHTLTVKQQIWSCCCSSHRRGALTGKLRVEKKAEDIHNWCQAKLNFPLRGIKGNPISPFYSSTSRAMSRLSSLRSLAPQLKNSFYVYSSSSSSFSRQNCIYVSDMLRLELTLELDDWNDLLILITITIAHLPLFYAHWGRGGMAREGGRVSKEDPHLPRHHCYSSVRLSQHSPPKLPIVVRRSYGYGDPFPHHDLC